MIVALALSAVASAPLALIVGTSLRDLRDPLRGAEDPWPAVAATIDRRPPRPRSRPASAPRASRPARACAGTRSVRTARID